MIGATRAKRRLKLAIDAGKHHNGCAPALGGAWLTASKSVHARSSSSSRTGARNGSVTAEDRYRTALHPTTQDEDALLHEKHSHAEAGAVWSLVQRVQDGDAEAFGLIYDAYVDVVFRYVYFRVHDKHLAEDFASETFTRALRRIDSVSYQGRDVGAWLITIARNIIRDHIKSSRYKLEVTSADMRDADRATDGPEDAVLAGLTHDELLRCVKQLSPEQQECIVLRFLQGLSVSETALAMDRNDGAIKALQHRAVRRLGKLLPEGFR